MDFKTTIGILAMLTVCELYAQTLKIQMQVFDGDKHYIHYGGKGNLDCIIDPIVEGYTLEFQEYENGNWKSVNAENQGSKIRLKLEGIFTMKRFRCRAMMGQEEKISKEAVVEMVGKNMLDVYLVNTAGKTLIKAEDKGPLKVICFTGGKVGQLFATPLQVLHGKDVLYENGNVKEGQKNYNTTVSFGGYEEESIYNAVTFNNPKEAVGDVTCKRDNSQQVITFVDKEDVGKVEVTLFKDKEIKGRLTKSAEDKTAPKLKSLPVLRVGDYVLVCTFDGGYPSANVDLTKNGLPVKTASDGNRYQAHLKLTTADQYIACNVTVPGLDEYVLKFKIDINEEPMPADCKTDSLQGKVTRTCTVGGKSMPASCNEMQYEVRWRKTGKVSMISNGTVDDVKVTCRNHESKINAVEFKIELFRNSVEGRDVVLYHTGQSKRTDKLDEYQLKPSTKTQDTGAAAALASFGKLALTLLASAAIFLF